jgi:putative hemolysin
VDGSMRETFTVTGPSQRSGRLTCALAANPAEVAEAMRLRWRIFVDEMNAPAPPDGVGLEADRFDPFCDHLLIRDSASRQVVGTYRILSERGAHAAGGYYSETEFRLDAVRNLGGRMMEVGRACVDPRYRNGAAISALWSGIFKYIFTGNYDYVIGCASIPLNSGPRIAAAICRHIAKAYPCSPELRVAPLCRFPLDEFAGPEDTTDARIDAAIPPLIKGYLRLGAWICAEPAWDQSFNTVDLLIVMPAARIDRRYFRRYLRDL